MNEEIKRPPIGILPKHMWIYNRLRDLEDAIRRYEDANFKVPEQWILERDEKLKLFGRSE